MMRSGIAGALTWALLLAGWIGFGSLAQFAAAGPASAIGLVAVWLLALGAASALVGNIRRPRRLQLALLASATLATTGWWIGAMPVGALWRCLPGLIGWAALVALAFRIQSLCGPSSAAEDRSRFAWAALGALLAWACLGDVGDLHALRLHLGALAAVSGVLLAVLSERVEPAVDAQGARGRTSVLGCALPGWSPADWQGSKRWPVSLAALVMLPMMCGLPWMLGLCRGGAISAPDVLAVHFAAMFAPALVVSHSPGLRSQASTACAGLLGLGALALLGGGSSAWWVVAVTHGSAWSIAWSVRGGPTLSGSTLHSGAVNVGLCVGVGLAISGAGLAGLAQWHLLIGATAVAASMAGSVARLIRSTAVPRAQQPAPEPS